MTSNADSNSPQLPQWQQRQLQRRNYLNDSLANSTRNSPTAIPAQLDLRGDVESGHTRPSTLISTSLHSIGATSTRQPSLSSLSTSGAYHTSPEVKSTSHPSASVPQAHSFSTARTSDSWATCSEHEGDNTLASTAEMANKPGDTMLSASNRKKRSELPPLNTSGLGVTQRPSIESSDEEKTVPEASIKLKPRKSSLKPKDTPPKSAKSAKEEEPEPDEKARARGPTERENQVLLKTFLEHVPPGTKAEDDTNQPKSAFDWDTSDDEGKSKVRKFFKKRIWPAEPKEIKPIRAVGGKSSSPGIMGEGVGTPRIGSEIYSAKSPSLARMMEQSMQERGFGPPSGSSTTSPPAMLNRSSNTSSEAAQSPTTIKRGGNIPRSRPFAQASPTPGAREGDRPPQIAQPFRRVASDTDLRTKTGSSGNAFAQEEARRKMVPNPQDAIHGASPGQNTTICYSDNTPTRPNFSQRFAERLKTSPRPTNTQSPTITTTSSFTSELSPFGMAHMPSPSGMSYPMGRTPPPVPAHRPPTSAAIPRFIPPVALPHTPSSGTMPPAPSPGGLPPGPEHPDWDDAVKWVKKEISKRNAREAKEAKELQKNAQKDDKRIRRLRAGKEIVKRQSQRGFMPRKSVEQITEDDFEAVGVAAMAASRSTPTIGSDMIGAFFTEIPGSAEDKARRANAIGRSLDNHASLQLLSEAEPSAIHMRRESQVHHDAALRMLEGETPVPDQLANPFETTSLQEAVGSYPSIGLGITSDEAAQAQEHAIQQQAKAQMGLEIHQPATSPEQHTMMPKAPTLKRVPYDPQMPPKRRMTTIEEAEKENSSSNSGSTGKAGPSQKGYPGGNVIREICPIAETEETETGRGDITQVKQNIQTLRYGQRTSDDNKSMDSMMTEDIPPPLQVPKARSHPTSPYGAGDSPASIYSPNIPIMHVSKSSQDLRPPGSSGFTPRRNSGFNQMIEQHSRIQAGKIGSHPALRGDEDLIDIYLRDQPDEQSEYSDRYYHDDHDVPQESSPRAARVDSGIGLGEREVMVSCKAKRVPTLVVPDEAAARDATDLDIQALRRELSLAPLQMPGPNTPKHPNHPFTWYHEKVMCWGAHNPKGSQPTPKTPATTQVTPSSVIKEVREKQAPTKETPTKAKIAKIDMCHICGINCCRFANLVLQTRISRGNDVTEEAIRMKAEQQVERLRQLYPNGIEEYDTFLNCLACLHKICPGCSTKCTEPHCQAVVCVECTDETGVCPVHNDDEE